TEAAAENSTRKSRSSVRVSSWRIQPPATLGLITLTTDDRSRAATGEAVTTPAACTTPRNGGSVRPKRANTSAIAVRSPASAAAKGDLVLAAGARDLLHDFPRGLRRIARRLGVEVHEPSPRVRLFEREHAAEAQQGGRGDRDRSFRCARGLGATRDDPQPHGVA